MKVTLDDELLNKINNNFIGMTTAEKVRKCLKEGIKSKKIKKGQNMKNKNIGAISLFSGAGGLDIASFMSNVPVIASLEIDKDCVETLKINDIFEDTCIFNEDISKFDTDNLKKILDEKKLEKFIVIGGAPCQPFSKNGYWTGERRKGIHDPRAKLVDEYLRVVQETKPDGFVFENVESLLHPKNKIIVDEFLSFIEEEGYKYKLVKANALEYGVSQKRKRIFILGTKGEFKSEFPEKTHAPKEKAEKLGLKPFVPVKNVIQKFNRDDLFEPQEITINGTYGKDLKEVPPGKNYIALTKKAGYPNPKFEANKRFWNFLLKLSPEEPSWTITAQPGPWVGPFHWTSRRLRVPEIAAIQSFPENYKFYGSRRSIQKQIGNAVPPLMGKAMINFVKESL